jgi:hypothetical protein
MAQDQLDSTAITEMQKHFAEAYNRGDADAMAAAFTEKAIRVTPSPYISHYLCMMGRFAMRLVCFFADAVRRGIWRCESA